VTQTLNLKCDLLVSSLCFQLVPPLYLKGLAWLFMGVANSDAKLYDDEIQECIARFPGGGLYKLHPVYPYG
jgi:hypothetical protein